MYTIVLATALLTSCPDGSLLFIEGGNRIVENETDSPYTHVAMIFNIDKEPWVFEAEPPRVRKVRFSEYVREVEKQNIKNGRQMKLWLMKPKIPFDRSEVLKMRVYLENQIDREYSIWSYVQGRVGDGIHCAELTTRTLLRGGINLRGNPCRQFPAGIMYKAQRTHLPKEKIIHYVRGEAKPVFFTNDCDNNSCWLWIEKKAHAACKRSRVLCPWW
tara:strand:+ start:101 stop:748 length:648 start_codon:yes stop_codon:yes gene_type:complete